MKINLYKKSLLFVLILLILVSCGLQGHLGVSNTMNESKRRNVFISEYEVHPNPYIMNDTLKIKVVNAWVEKQWGFGQSDKETIIIKDKYQLIIKVESNSLKSYGITWRIGVDGDKYIRSCGSDCLISNFNQLPQDKEEWKVQNGIELDSFSNKTIIGTFKIYKKIIISSNKLGL